MGDKVKDVKWYWKTFLCAKRNGQTKSKRILAKSVLAQENIESKGLRKPQFQLMESVCPIERQPIRPQCSFLFGFTWVVSPCKRQVDPRS